MTEATIAVVADTHIVIWYLLNPAKLSQEATAALERCVAANETIRVSAHSLVELVYTAERAKNPFTEKDRQVVLGAFAAEDSPFEVVPVTAEIANRVVSVPRAANDATVDLSASWPGRSQLHARSLGHLQPTGATSCQGLPHRSRTGHARPGRSGPATAAAHAWVQAVCGQGHGHARGGRPLRPA